MLNNLLFLLLQIGQPSENLRDSVFINERPEERFGKTELLLNRDFDFEVETVSEPGKFRVRFLNNSGSAMDIKIYDIIGNLVKQDNVSLLGEIDLVYDLSTYRSRLFVIEIGNAKYNLAKSVVTL